MSTASPSSSDSPRPARWPSVSDYNEAVQNLHVSMADNELRGGIAVPGVTGLPMPYAGGFADVYKVECPATGNTWAVKFFKREIRGLRERYRAISEHLAQTRLPFMVDFHYLDEGVRIAGRWYPIVKLRWVEGLTLNQFVGQSLDQPRMLDQLIGMWVKLAGRLREARIAHADLQHGNVMLVPRGDQGNLLLKLIDYDGMWVPALAGRPSGEVGHRHFQHPRRAADNVYSADVDRFSHLVICCALRCLSIGGRALWERFDNGDNLLFSESDFASPGTSALFRELWTFRHPDARALVGRAALASQAPLDQTPQIDELIMHGRVRPLDEAELRTARALLDPTGAVRALPVARPLPPSPAATPVIPADAGAGPTTGVASPESPVQNAPAPIVGSTAEVPETPPNSPQGMARPLALLRAFDDWLARRAGAPRRHQLLRTATASALVLMMSLVGLSMRSFVRGPNERPDVAEEEETGDTDKVPVKLSPDSSGATAKGPAVKDLDLGDTISLSIGMELKRISAGEFLMGAATGNPDEQPAHRVRITRDFFLGIHEVTRAQYLAVLENSANKLPVVDRPVENVSWDEAQEFCRRLTERERGALPAGWAFRLPTEAEWEYACRAGTIGKYSFGGDERQVDEYAWHKGNANGLAQAVGQKKSNAWGLYDMHGNVWEWCQDPYDAKYYATSPAANPSGPASGVERVRRGGSWRAAHEDCRSSYRFKCGQSQRYDDIGFRVALGPSGPADSALAETSEPPSEVPSDNAPSDSSNPAKTPPPLAVVPFSQVAAKQHQESWAKYLGELVEKEVVLLGGEKLELVLIPAGEFTRSEDSKSSFRVRLTKPFYLGKYEVTQAQWQAVMGTNPSKFRDDPTLPVEQVSWDDIQSFLAKLNAFGAIGSSHFGLPTEAQWEYACRAGTTSTYSFGNNVADLPQYGWYALGKSYPVGQLKPNPFGLYDMHGNVLEWCSDWYEDGYFAKAPLDDPPGPSQGSTRVLRGGNWGYVAVSCRSASRITDAPTLRSNDEGFRLALSPSSPVSVASAEPMPVSSTPELAPTPSGSPPPLAVVPFKEAEAKQRQQAWASFLGQPVEKEITLPGGEKLAMVLIPAGEFEREENNQKFRVRLTRPFYLGKYEVTQAQWKAVMGSNPSKSIDSSTHPVETVSWDEIQPFFAKLNANGAAGSWHFDLPTEAQWEYACRAGTTTIYSFGDSAADLPQYGWFMNNAPKQSHPVGQLKPNPFDLYDMHGNVWEWCFDWLEGDYFAKAPLENPPGPAQGSYKMSRGGGWGDVADACAAMNRNTLNPRSRTINQGFRLALIPSSTASLVPAKPVKSKPTGPATLQPEGPTKSADSPPPLAIVPFKEAAAKQHQQAWASFLGQPVEKETTLPGGEKLAMVLIPPGEFTRSEDSRSSFRVRMTKPFYLGKYEVTQTQWQAVMGTNPSQFKDSSKNPVESVSWDDVQPFVTKLNASGAGGTWRFDLPTEAQWEYACRAGTTSKYSFGDSDADLPQYAWFAGKADNKTHPVGQLRPNPFGLHDMHGNVWEWCLDWHEGGYYAKAPIDDPPGPSQRSSRVIRGGSWVYDATDCRTARRGASDPTYRWNHGGFRLALSPTGVGPESWRGQGEKPIVPVRGETGTGARRIGHDRASRHHPPLAPGAQWSTFGNGQPPGPTVLVQRPAEADCENGPREFGLGLIVKSAR